MPTPVITSAIFFPFFGKCSEQRSLRKLQRKARMQNPSGANLFRRCRVPTLVITPAIFFPLSGKYSVRGSPRDVQGIARQENPDAVGNGAPELPRAGILGQACQSRVAGKAAANVIATSAISLSQIEGTHLADWRRKTRPAFGERRATIGRDACTDAEGPMSLPATGGVGVS